MIRAHRSKGPKNEAVEVSFIWIYYLKKARKEQNIDIISNSLLMKHRKTSKEFNTKRGRKWLLL